MSGVGVVLGGGYNAWYMNRVTEWGYFSCRSRHLIDLSEAVEPSEPSIVDAEVVDDRSGAAS